MLINTLLSLGISTTLAWAEAKTYRIDPVHSRLSFEVPHLMSKVEGHFLEFEGDFTFDPENLKNSKVSVKIQPTSLTTHHTKRDEHLKSPDFFDVKKYAEIQFISKSVTEKKKRTPRDPTLYLIAGTLKLHGISKDIVLEAQPLGTAIDPWGARRIGFQAHASLNRRDFGIQWNRNLTQGGYLIGDDVELTIMIEGIEQVQQEPEAKKKD